MKIVFLSSTGQLGGAENVLLDALASLREARPAWALDLIAASEGPLVERARAIGVGATVLSFPAALARLGDAGAGGPAGLEVSRARLALRLSASLPEVAGYVRALRRSLGRLSPEVIHTNGFKMHALGAWARPRGAALVWHVHDYVSSRPFAARMLRASVRRCDAAIANSQSVASDVRALTKGRLKVWTVPNAVNLEQFTPAGETVDLDALAGLPSPEPDTVRVGLVATLARWKGHDTFLRALSMLPVDSRVRGYVTGDALYQTEGSQYRLEELRLLASQLGVEGRVGFTGFVPDAAAAMRSLDVVVHASTAPEPFGLVIAEAMACGRALIASEAGGAAELFNTGENALGHAPGDAEGLASRIAQLARDAPLRAALGRAGRATALQRFDRTRLAAELIPVYEEVRNAKRGTRISERESVKASAVLHQSAFGNPIQSASRNPHSAFLRVLHLHSGNLYGGVETLLATLARERGACRELEQDFALCFEGRLSEELADAGLSVHALGAARVSRPASVWRARRELKRLLRERRFDLIVSHSAWTQTVFGPVLRASKLPHVFWMHAPAGGTHWLERAARRTPPDLVICNSHFTAKHSHKLYPRARAEVVYCPVSPEASRMSEDERASLRAGLDTPESAVVVVQVGRMESLKGHAVHLEALGMLREVSGWVCWQVGGAQRPSEVGYVEELKALAARLGISERVRFAGERSDVPRLLAASDIYCQPNVSPESFGLTFAEALLQSLPVVTTNIGGATEIVDDSCGVLVPPGDAHALAATLRTLIDEEPLRRALGSSGPARVRELCDPSERIRQLHRLLCEARDERRSDGD
jgi:glycosyltransferase involved in cell wall biosynthesis